MEERVNKCLTLTFATGSGAIYFMCVSRTENQVSFNVYSYSSICIFFVVEYWKRVTTESEDCRFPPKIPQKLASKVTILILLSVTILPTKIGFVGAEILMLGPLQNCQIEFVNLLRSSGIDSQPGGLVRQPYLTYRPTRLHTL
jgi:hypothetical protein